MRPSWLDNKAYPFEDRYVYLPAGRMHYIDEGEGEILVMVHGNPDWSFSFRKIIKQLRNYYRCIAMDHLGFGLSQKPESWSYLPRDHAQNFELFIKKLRIEKFSLVVSDWGGPIALAYAIRNPGQIKKLIVINSWMWSVKKDPLIQAFSRFMGGKAGYYLIRNYNFFGGILVKFAMGKPWKVPSGVYRHYSRHLGSPGKRRGNWIFPRELVRSSSWLEGLWGKKDRLIHKPLMLAWGMRDPAFGKRFLNKWKRAYPLCKVVRFPEAGHFPQEEKGIELAGAIHHFMRQY